MTEEVLFKSEQGVTRENAVKRLRDIAERLEDGSIELSEGGNSVSLRVPTNIEFEIKVEQEGHEKSLEIELEWDEREDSEPSDLEIS